MAGECENAYIDSLEKENTRLKEELNLQIDRANEKEQLNVRLKRVLKEIADMI